MADITETSTEIDDVDAPVSIVTEKTRDPSPFEKRLRTEKAKEVAARQAAEQALSAYKAEAESRVAEVHKSAAARIIRAEVKAHAVQAGLVDMDALALIDLSTCTLDDAGNVANAAEAIAAAKKAKPYLFSGTTTSSTAPAPKNEPARDFNVKTASVNEILAFERKMGLRR